MYEIRCDIAACGAVIQSSESGQPTLSGKKDIYCDRCAGYIASVDREIDRISSEKSWALVTELEQLRKEKIAAALPQQLSDAPREGDHFITVPQ